MNDHSNDVQGAAANLDQFLLSDDQMVRVIEAVMQGGQLGVTLGYSEKEIENFYCLAHQTYGAGNFEDAHKLFQFLCRMQHLDSRFWMGLGACRQGMGQYAEAIDAYSMSASTEGLDNPQPFLHMAACFVQCNEPENARTVLSSLLVLGDEKNPHHAACHDKARHMLQLLHTKSPTEQGSRVASCN